LCVVKATVTIVNNGTGSNTVNIDLPFTAAGNGTAIGAGRETAVIGSMLQVKAAGNATVMGVKTYADLYPAGNGYTLEVTLSYEVA
jgi:hypothetical protein